MRDPERLEKAARFNYRFPQGVTICQPNYHSEITIELEGLHTWSGAAGHSGLVASLSLPPAQVCQSFLYKILKGSWRNFLVSNSGISQRSRVAPASSAMFSYPSDTRRIIAPGEPLLAPPGDGRLSEAASRHQAHTMPPLNQHEKRETEHCAPSF